MSTLVHLRAEALAARHANQPGRAVAAWRALLDAAPDDWTLALELKQDLQAGWHYPDSCPRFRRAARALPDSAWLAHYAPLPVLPGAELDAIRDRALSLRASRPGDAGVEALLGQVARQSRHWVEAARAFAAAARLDAANPDWPRHAAEARMYARLAGQAARAADYGFVVINLDRNAARMAEVARQCAGFRMQPARLPGIDGALLPGPAVRRLTGSVSAPRGTLGCFLSHVAAWERLLAGPQACALVMEDDAIPLLDPSAAIAAASATPGWHVVWVNDRMQPRGNPDGTTGFAVQPVAARMQGFDPGQDAVGTDGYLVSRAGARALLEWTAADGFAGNVDWRMLAYALSPAARGAIPAGSMARTMLDENAPEPPRTERLNALALHPALVREVPLQSDRQDADRLTMKGTAA